MSGLTKLSLASLATIEGGKIAAAFDHAIRRAADDCDDRPNEERPRKVILQIEFVPVLADGDVIADSVQSQIQIKDSLPTRKSRKIDLGLRKGGMFVFQDMALDNHRQNTLPMSDEE